MIVSPEGAASQPPSRLKMRRAFSAQYGYRMVPRAMPWVGMFRPGWGWRDHERDASWPVFGRVGRLSFVATGDDRQRGHLLALWDVIAGKCP